MEPHDTNHEPFTGVAEIYDGARPHPPEGFLDLLVRLLGRHPELVVDLGSGTGLSTRSWIGRAGRVIGVEPNASMRRRAEASTQGVPGAEIVSYREGTGAATGLPDAGADCVTTVRSLQWMEPESTFREVARILRPGGLFGICDYDLPPRVHPEVDAAYEAMRRRVRASEARLGIARPRWRRDGHRGRLQASERFRRVREMTLRSVETGDAARLFSLACSQSSVPALLQRGISEADLGLDALRETAARVLGEAPAPWRLTFHVLVATR